MLGIGAYEPRWFIEPIHMSPAEAVRAHADLGASAHCFSAVCRFATRRLQGFGFLDSAKS